jgi:outer membrane protein
MKILRTGTTLAVVLLAWHPATAEDLIDIYNTAVAADPTIREAAAIRQSTLETKPQAFSALLPQIEGQYRLSYSEQSGSQTSTPAVDSDNDGSLDTILTGSTGFSQQSDPSTRFWQLQVTQTLFRWDQWVALKQADLEVARAEADYRAAQQGLMTRVARRYFDVLGAQATLVAADSAKEAIGRQLEQAEKRFEVGLIAITDVQEAQASYDSAVATVIEAKRSLATAREFVREITGQYHEKLADAGPETPLISPNPDDVELWVTTAIQQNLRLEASRLAADISRKEISSRQSGHLPYIDLFAQRSNNNAKARRQDKPQQAGAVILPGGPANNDTWNDVIGVQVNVPIYSGGNVSSLVDQAEYDHQASLQRLERVARETERQTRDSFLSVNSEISRVQALARSVESNETALRATEAGFEVGTRTTVDVLDARRRLFEAQRDYARSRYTYLTNTVQLKEAAGTLSEADLRRINDWLKE